MIGFAISIPIWCISEVIRTQYLLPHGRDNQYMLSFIIGLIINAISNVLLIPIWGAIGAILSIILSELMMSFIQAWFIRKEVCIKYSIYKCIPYVIIAFNIYTYSQRVCFITIKYNYNYIDIRNISKYY